ncbi:MAG TPA: efflux RND transporter periplasmic adaptor subunit [Candidatus Pacebacteria bacterium]|nr:efflux RND transporter periplasmic adaptor subunit [Candidatus Paceibacterota bacterium]
MKNNYKIGKIILISLPILFLVILFFAFSEKEKEENIENSEISLKEKKELDKIGEITENKKYKKISDLIFGETAIVNYGKVIAEKEIKITPEIPGKIEWVNVEVGDMVKKGDILIGLKKTDEENSLNAAILNSEISSLAYEKALSPVRDEDKEIAKKDVQLKNFLLNKTQLDIARQLGDIRLSLDEILRKEIDDFFDHTDIDSYVYVPTYTYRLKSRIKMEKMEELRKSLGIDFDFYYKN